MDAQFLDRILICSDCHGEFIFTAGEQLFFHDKQFKNDPKRCKPCKSRRTGLAAVANGTGPASAGLSRTETRTECSECGVQTTVPFKPTQGRPVLCRQCFQAKIKNVGTAPPLTGTVTAAAFPTPAPSAAQTISALTAASVSANGMALSADAATSAAASMASASAQSSVASAADLASISNIETKLAAASVAQIPPELLAAAISDGPRPNQMATPSAKSSEA